MMANTSSVVRSFLFFSLLLIPLSCTTDENDADIDLKLSVSKLVLDENGQGQFTISTNGDGQYKYTILKLPEWLSVGSSNNEGIVTSNGLLLEVAATSNLITGSYTGTIEISAEGAGTVSLAVEYIKIASNLSISETKLDFGFLKNELTFTVLNLGGQDFNWEVVNTNPVIRYEPTSGRLSSGGSVMVTAILDRSSLVNNVPDISIDIKSDLQQSIAQLVSIDYFLEEKLLISGSVVDVEYDRKNDVMIIVSTSPNEIRKFDTKNRQITSLALNMPPNCVSIGADGGFAAVGHNGRFSYVNLETMQLDKMYEVSCDASDIVLAPNNWVYVFQKEYQGSEFRCIRLSNGLETLSNDWGYYNSKAKLHPSGKYIYMANNGVTPSDFDKYDITEGTAVHLYDSPYHGDFEFAGNIWMNEVGDRLFAKSGNVFDATEDKSTDMRYDGALEGNKMISAMDVHTAANKVYAVLETGDGWPKIPSNAVSVYDAEFLTYQSKIKLPGFFKGGDDEHPGFYDSEGHFGFFNAKGNQFYVVVKTKSNYDPYDGSNYYFPDNWAIVTVPVE